jgi:glutathione S-transferase
MESSIVLGYWSIRGLGEVVRLFLEYLGLKYDEVKYADRAKWFEEDKPKLNTPFPNLPYLKDGDKVISETGNI